MSAFSSTKRWILLAGLSLALWGCGQRTPSPSSDAKPARSEASKPAGVVEATPEENPPKLKEALEKARASWEEYLPDIDDTRNGMLARLYRDQEIGKALASVQLGLVDIPIYREHKTPPWNKVRLNRAGAGLDAIRFTNAYGFKGDLIWAFVLPAETRLNWCITSSTGMPQGDAGFKQYYRKNNLILAGLDLPPRNIVVFQQLEDGQVGGGREYFLCFLFQDQEPKDVYVKLGLLNPQRGESPHMVSAHPVAEKLGIELPLRFSDAATLTDLASDIAQQQGADAGLSYLAQHLAKTSDRAAEFYQARLAHDHASQLAAKPETRKKSTPYFQQAAAAMRQFHKKYDPLEEQERQLLAVTLYNEACTLALAGQAEKGLESLREAVQAGFKDVAQIRGDDDLQSVRELPAFREWLKQLVPEASESPFR